MRALTEIIAGVGKGTAYPMRFDQGGVVQNMGATPTLEEAKLAARGAIRAIARVGLGQIPYNRDEGTLLSELRGKNPTPAMMDAAVESTISAIARNAEFVEGVTLSRTDPPVSGIFDGSSFRVTASYAFARTVEQQGDDFDLVAGAERG